jgi:hypothetical protein
MLYGRAAPWADPADRVDPEAAMAPADLRRTTVRADHLRVADKADLPRTSAVTDPADRPRAVLVDPAVRVARVDPAVREVDRTSLR